MHMRARRPVAALILGATAALVASAWVGSLSARAAYVQGGTLPGLGTGRIWSLAASPSTAGLVVAGTDKGVFVSTDAGATWTATPLSGIRVWAVGFDARDATRLFAGTDGHGVEISTNAGATWTAASTGLPDRTVRSFAFGLDGIAAGTNNGVALSPDGVSWHPGGLDRYAISSLAVAANSPTLELIATADRGDLSNGYVFRFAGTGWQALQSGLPSVAIATSVAAGPLSTAVTKRPLVITTSKGTYRSGDSGTTWTASTGLPENLSLTTAVFSPLDPSLVYAGADQGSSNGGAMMRSTDGGATFTAADSGLPDKTRQVVGIAVEPTTPPAVVVGIDPMTGGQVYTSSDATAPAPPTLVAESPGATVPSTLATATPSPSASAAPVATPTPASSSGFGHFVSNVVHWPVPLVFEVLLVLLLAYVFVRWRARYYVEGPP
jgi:hypothetical protein